MKKSPVPSHNLGTFPSPGAPDYYRDNNSVGCQKGWYSERVPHPATNSRRYISAAALTPFYSGRTLPSKWEDAERWICSPVSGNNNSILQQPQRRPKSKSGPLGPPGAAGYYSNYSPAVPAIDGGGGVRNLVVGSPFSTGVFRADGLSVYYGGSGGAVGGGGESETEKNVARSTSVPGWSDLLSESNSFPSSIDECTDDKFDGNKEEEGAISGAVSRRDMATQMSPEGSTYPSPRRDSSLRTSPSRPVEDQREESEQPGKLEVRDVQVDKRATAVSCGARRSKKQPQDHVEDFKTSIAAEARGSSWAVEEATNNVTKSQREEAKIAAWENLQKAKAEAAIRKLEMKLEKKRSSAMDKILKKLKRAQLKAEKMRSSISTAKKHGHSKPLMGCFTTCHAL